MNQHAEYGLEFLLAFDGHTHWYEGGYHTRFEIRRVPATPERPHGLRYSLTLHDPQGRRLLGYDNAHRVAAKGSRFKGRPAEADHWHRTRDDPGEPYRFVDAVTLLDDFFNEVESVLREQGIPMAVRETRQRPTED